jgi:glycopeptide antibiotics resistance protein
LFARDIGLLLEAVSNVLLFIPFGVALGLRGLGIGKSALLALLVSAAFECAQFLFVPGRTTSVDDVLLNVTGAVVGHALISRWLQRHHGRECDGYPAR